MNIVLASTSPYRRQQLKALGVDFNAVAPDCDETPLPDETAEQLVKRLASAKAQSVVAQYSDSLIIGSDQVASFKQKIIGKPHTRENAIKQLAQFSGQKVTFYTGISIINSDTQFTISRVLPVTVYFRKLSELDIKRYVAIEQPLDCAGSFKSEGLGSALFEKIESEDPSALIGLPMITLCDLLRQHNLDLLASLAAD
jgi:MAF protein